MIRGVRGRRAAAPLVLAGLAGLAAIVPAGCSGGPATSVPSSASASSESASASSASSFPLDASATVPGTGTPRPGATSDPASVPRTGAVGVGGDAGDLDYRVSFRPRTTVRTTPSATITYPEVTVTGGTDPAVRSALTALVSDAVTGGRKTFEATLADLAPVEGGSEQEITVSREVRWGFLYSVELADYSFVAGAAHPNDGIVAVTVDLRTGRALRAVDLFTDVKPVDQVLRARLRTRNVDADSAATVTVGRASDSVASVASYPAPAGLRVGVSRCVVVCALGTLELTLPWSELPAPVAGTLPTTSEARTVTPSPVH